MAFKTKEQARRWNTPYKREWRKRNPDWQKKWKRKAVELLGGKCQLCGCDDIDKLEYAHLDRTGEVYRGALDSRARRVLAEPSRFLLLCWECHHHPEKYLKELIDMRKSGK